METGINLTGYDFYVLGILLLFVGRGIWLGLLRQVAGLLSLYLGYFVASQYHDRLFPFLKEISESPQIIFAISFVVLFVATYVIAMLLGKALGYVIEITINKWFDKFLGGLLGVAKGALVVVILHMILGTVLAPESTIQRKCMSCGTINMATDYARDFIRDEDVRKSLKQQTPAISPEVVREFLDEPPMNELSQNKPQAELLAPIE